MNLTCQTVPDTASGTRKAACISSFIRMCSPMRSPHGFDKVKAAEVLHRAGMLTRGQDGKWQGKHRTPDYPSPRRFYRFDRTTPVGDAQPAHVAHPTYHPPARRVLHPVRPNQHRFRAHVKSDGGTGGTVEQIQKIPMKAFIHKGFKCSTIVPPVERRWNKSRPSRPCST